MANLDKICIKSPACPFMACGTHFIFIRLQKYDFFFKLSNILMFICRNR